MFIYQLNFPFLYSTSSNPLFWREKQSKSEDSMTETYCSVITHSIRCNHMEGFWTKKNCWNRWMNYIYISLFISWKRPQTSLFIDKYINFCGFILNSPRLRKCLKFRHVGHVCVLCHGCKFLPFAVLWQSFE